MFKFLKQLFIVMFALVCTSGLALADDDVLKPFVLGSKGAGTVAEKAEAAKLRKYHYMVGME